MHISMSHICICCYHMIYTYIYIHRYIPSYLPLSCLQLPRHMPLGTCESWPDRRGAIYTNICEYITSMLYIYIHIYIYIHTYMYKHLYRFNFNFFQIFQTLIPIHFSFSKQILRHFKLLSSVI
jgi:hypothetical protein